MSATDLINKVASDVRDRAAWDVLFRAANHLHADSGDDMAARYLAEDNRVLRRMGFNSSVDYALDTPEFYHGKWGGQTA